MARYASPFLLLAQAAQLRGGPGHDLIIDLADLGRALEGALGGTRVIQATVDFAGTAFKETGRTFDFGIDGDGFFALFDPDTREISYTRDGSFMMAQFFIQGFDYLDKLLGDVRVGHLQQALLDLPGAEIHPGRIVHDGTVLHPAG